MDDTDSEKLKKCNWWCWLQRFAVVAAPISIFMTIFFYSESVSVREPYFHVYPHRTNIFNPVVEKRSFTVINKSTGKQIEDEITAATFYFWNEGKSSIKKTDILEPIHIIFHEPVEILEASITDLTRPKITKSALEINPSEQTVVIKFDILEYGDAIRGQIIFVGKPDVKISIKGVIEGVNEIGMIGEDSFIVSTRTKIESRLYGGIAAISAYVVVVVAFIGLLFLLLFVVFGITNLFTKNKKEKSAETEQGAETEQEEEKGDDKMTKSQAITLGMVVIVVVVVFIYSFNYTVDKFAGLLRISTIESRILPGNRIMSRPDESVLNDADKKSN